MISKSWLYFFFLLYLECKAVLLMLSMFSFWPWLRGSLLHNTSNHLEKKTTSFWNRYEKSLKEFLCKKKKHTFTKNAWSDQIFSGKTDMPMTQHPTWTIFTIFAMLQSMILLFMRLGIVLFSINVNLYLILITNRILKSKFEISNILKKN